MPVDERTVSFRTLDGLQLTGTFTSSESPERVAVLVHGGGVTRDEGGFFTRLAAGLANAGVASLRYDQRGHGESQGSQETRTLAEHLNDLQVALAESRRLADLPQASLLGTSFGGGIAAYYAAKRPSDITRLALLNPQLNYKDRYIEQKPHWHGDFLDDAKAETLRKQGYLDHSDAVKHSREFLNEVFWLRPNEVIGEITVPTLLVHGTEDTFVSVETSRQAAEQLRVEHRLVEIDGAQHGFAVDQDPEYADPQTQEWQAFVIQTVTDWLAAG